MSGIPVKWQLLFLSIYLTINIVLCSPETFSNHLEWYASMIQSVLTRPAKEDIEDDNRVIYTYQTAFHGVAARLSEEEAERLDQLHCVMALFPETKYQLHTTRSPLFLGLEPEDSTSARVRRVEPSQSITVIEKLWVHECSTVDTRVLRVKLTSKMSTNRHEIKTVMELTLQQPLRARLPAERIFWATPTGQPEVWPRVRESQFTKFAGRVGVSAPIFSPLSIKPWPMA
ncbi:hypothetical protein CsSME_00001576 [Camellia sinensis var. sinensis]